MATSMKAKILKKEILSQYKSIRQFAIEMGIWKVLVVTVVVVIALCGLIYTIHLLNYEQMVETIKEQATSFLFKVIIKNHEEEEVNMKDENESVEYTSEDENGVEVEEGELTPDSPCPCGSGKKYKNCCGRV